MKSSLSDLERDKGRYTAVHYKAISDNGFRYYHSACEGVMLNYEGKWTPYPVVQELVKSLPEVTYED